MKIAVLGSVGMAGHLIAQYLHESGHDVTTYGRSCHPEVKTRIIDARDYLSLVQDLEINRYGVIINCFGLLNQNANENRSDAILINSFLPNFLSEFFLNHNVKIIHLSTDCVFSGKNGPYEELSTTNGETFYDKTKILGEFTNKKDLIFRNSIIGPEYKKNGIGLMHWFLSQKAVIQGFTNVIWNGITTLTLAKAIERVIDVQLDLSGIYHLASKPISKYNLLQILKSEFNHEIIIEKSDFPVSNKTLMNTRNDFGFAIPSHEEMIHDLLLWVSTHKSFYHHYIFGG